MVKITKSKNQYRINIPREIIIQTGWDETTEVTFTPYIKDPSDPITENTPVLIKKLNVAKND
jgi:hypothetical protein